MKLGTICVQGAYRPKNGEPRVLPIVQSTTYKYDSSVEMGNLFDLKASGYFYSRLQNPTNDTVAGKITMLEGGVAGMLTFVGLIVPHMMRLVVGSDFNYLLPSSAIFGGILLIVADTVARTAFSPIEVPVGVFMSFIGAPFFLYLLKRGMQKR